MFLLINVNIRYEKNLKKLKSKHSMNSSESFIFFIWIPFRWFARNREVDALWQKVNARGHRQIKSYM